MDDLDYEIKKFISDNIHFINNNNYNHLSLLTGLGSKIILQTTLKEYLPNNDYSLNLDLNIEFFFNLIESNHLLSSTYSTGLSGAAWLILYLNDNKIIEIDPDVFLEEIDIQVESDLIAFLKKENLDILHGALGLGIYLLKRRRMDGVINIITFLEKNGINENNSYKWEQKGTNYEGGSSFDLGLAHGQASILYFLGRCYKNNVCKKSCKLMINGIISFYFNNIQDHKKFGSFWPNLLPKKKQLSNSNEFKSRLAWCYGDLGILHTMYLTSHWLNDKKIKTKVEKLLMISMDRKKEAETMIDDSYFCHGESGILSICISLFGLSGNQYFRINAEYWAKQIIERFKKNEIELTSDKSGILAGLEGVLLSLHLLETSEMDKWTECVFLK